MTILIFLIVTYILLSYSLTLLFPQAGVEASKGWIPGVNFGEWAQIIGRKKSYAWRLLIPIYNIFVFAGMAIDMVRSFGKYTFWDSVLAVVYTPLKFFMVAKDEDAKYVGPTVQLEEAYAEKLSAAEKSNNEYAYKKLQEGNPYKKGIIREWTESIIFAVFAAAFIRMFLIEAFVIPTPSMEGSLNVGDYLFVSKAHYGIRTPMTVLQIPLAHNRAPVVGGESYLTEPSLPYYRLPAFQKIKRGSPFVFNWPVGDSVYVTQSRAYTVNQVKREPGYMEYDAELRSLVRKEDYIVRPIDKKDHYIKRAVAIPGDKLEIRKRQLYINDAPVKNPEHLQFLYRVKIPADQAINRGKLEEIGVDWGDVYAARSQNVFASGNQEALFLDSTQVRSIKSMYPGAELEIVNMPKEPGKLFPHDTEHFPDWSVDNYGPITIPAKGMTVELSPENIALYKRIIGVYEGNDLEISGDKIIINSQEVDSYTFQQDYYWAMGDNRHNSEDSRAWGFVPFDHVVGKPLFIWFSTKEGNMANGINWDRIFKSASE